MIAASQTKAQRLDDMWAVIPCAHGYTSHHCARDDEGSCPWKGDCPDWCTEALKALGWAEISNMVTEFLLESP